MDFYSLVKSVYDDCMATATMASGHSRFEASDMAHSFSLRTERKIEEYKDHIDSLDRLDPAKVDQGTLELLDGGSMRQKDYVSLMKRFISENNTTMQRILFDSAKAAGIEIPFVWTSSLSEAMPAIQALQDVAYYSGRYIHSKRDGDAEEAITRLFSQLLDEEDLL